MESIYAIRVDQNDFISRYRVSQVVQTPVGKVTIDSIKQDMSYVARFGNDCYDVIAKDEDGKFFIYKKFINYSVEITHKVPNTDDKYMEQLLRIAGYFED